MTARRRSKDQCLAGSVETLRYIVNLEFPALCGLPAVGSELETFLSKVRFRTQVYWPELWADEPGQRPPESMLRRMRDHLRRFWEHTDDPRARDWYIHRAREFYQETRVLRATRAERELVRKAATKDETLSLIVTRVNPRAEDTLDQVPPHTPFEDALFELQRRADWPSTRPRRCSLFPSCVSKKGPYFLSDVKGRKFCSLECFQASQRKIKAKSWLEHKQEWRKK